MPRGDRVLKLVIYPPVDPERLERIVASAGAMSVRNTFSEAEALGEIVDADALFGKITPSLLSASRRLGWVQAPTASLEHYMFPELIEHPCRLTNMRGLFSDVIGDHVFGYILCFARNFHRYIRHQLEGRWEAVGGESERPAVSTGLAEVGPVDRAHMHLADTVLGIVGLGGIGSEVARRGQALRMTVVAVDPVRTEAKGVAAVWKPERLPDLLAKSDFVVIAAAHTPQTEKLFRRPQFHQMKRTAYLINVGRGIIVDLADLTAALQSGELAGAGLDVFETEPLPSGHPLWQMENVIITPHMAGHSPRIAGRHLEVLLDNIGRFAQGRALRNVVDKASWF